jgi:heptosyltransferase-2
VNSSRGKILVIRGGAIGDFILTLPAVAALRRQFPDAHLEVLGYPHIVQLALTGGLADRVQSIEARALAGFFARDGTLEPDWADYFSEFDLIVSYLYDPDAIFRTNIARCSQGQFIAGPHRPNEKEKIHATKVYLKPLEHLAIFDADSVPRLSLNKQPSTLNQLALLPGSGSEKKNWPEEKWAELLQHLISSTPFDLLLVGGEAEGGRLQRLAAALPQSRVRVAQNLPLAELARRLEPCAGFVGHDSGISHLAAAVGLPGLVLWAEAAEEIWRPPHKSVIILKSDAGVKAMSAERVIRELARLALPKGQPATAVGRHPFS